MWKKTLMKKKKHKKTRGLLEKCTLCHPFLLLFFFSVFGESHWVNYAKYLYYYLKTFVLITFYTMPLL